ncbi:formate dehydrogenase accessory sulfurtransferase FdhD, partial [bacterium]|nr:formate dehydrogenase accessory sulfurtransferase FdhD [bacterium]
MNMKIQKIKTYKNGEYTWQEDKVCIEDSLDVYINCDYYISVMTIFNQLKEFIVGFLFFEGFISNYSDIIDIEIKESEIRVNVVNYVKKNSNEKKVLTTGCGNSITSLDMKKPAPCKKIDISMRFLDKKIIELMKEFNKKSDLF